MKLFKKIVCYTLMVAGAAYLCIDFYIYFKYEGQRANNALEWAEVKYGSVPDDSIPDNLINAYEKVYPGSLTNHIYPDFIWLVSTRLNGRNYPQELLAYPLNAPCGTIELVSFANQLENRLTAKQIIYGYLMETDFLNQAEGVNEAARIYYKKTLKELNETECIELAVMTRNPSVYNKFTRQKELDKKVKEITGSKK